MWLPINLNENNPEPLYHQIEVQLRALIISGQLENGTLLPSIRELAQMLKCSVITVRRVYQDLEAEGLLRTRQGTGTFVASVLEEDRDRQRTASVVEAVEAAIDAGMRVQLTRTEMLQIMNRVMDERWKES